MKYLQNTLRSISYSEGSQAYLAEAESRLLLAQSSRIFEKVKKPKITESLDYLNRLPTAAYHNSEGGFILVLMGAPCAGKL